MRSRPRSVVSIPYVRSLAPCRCAGRLAARATTWCRPPPRPGAPGSHAVRYPARPCGSDSLPTRRIGCCSWIDPPACQIVQLVPRSTCLSGLAGMPVVALSMIALFVPSARLFKVGLKGGDIHRLGFNQALEVLARINQPLCTDHSLIVDQYCVGHTANSIAYADLGRYHIRDVADVMVTQEALVIIRRTIADDNHGHVLLATQGPNGRQQLVAHRTGRRQKYQKRILCLPRPTDLHRSTGKIVHLEGRSFVADIGSGVGHHGAQWSRALMQQANLPS